MAGSGALVDVNIELPEEEEVMAVTVVDWPESVPVAVLVADVTGGG